MGIPEGRNFQEKITKAATDAVKGAGRFTKGRDLDDGVDGAEIFTKSHDAIMRTKAAMAHGVHDSDSVIGGWSSDFQRHEVFAPLAYRAKADAEVRKNFTAQNLGSSGAPYGLVPFDLSAPSRLVYPVGM